MPLHDQMGVERFRRGVESTSLARFEGVRVSPRWFGPQADPSGRSGEPCSAEMICIGARPGKAFLIETARNRDKYGLRGGGLYPPVLTGLARGDRFTYQTGP